MINITSPSHYYQPPATYLHVQRRVSSSRPRGNEVRSKMEHFEAASAEANMFTLCRVVTKSTEGNM